MRKRSKNLLAALAFCLAVFLLACALSAVLNTKSETMMAFYAEPKESIDVLFVGSSHCMAAFSPAAIWQQEGFTSYNLYSLSQPMWTSYHYIKEALKTQSPKVVVLDAFGMSYGNTYITPENLDSVSDDYSLLIKPSLNRLELAMAMSRSQVHARPFYRYLPLLRYHGRWKSLTREDFTWYFEDHYSTNKGYAPLFETEAFAPPVPLADPPESEVYPPAMEYLHKTIELSRQEGFALVVAWAPYIPEDAEWDVFRQVEDLCAAEGVPVLNYITDVDCGFSYETDLAEHAHVNLFGSEKVSAHIGAWLAENYELEDRRGQEEYAYWEQAAATDQWDLEKMMLRLSPTPAEYFSRLQDDRLVAFVVSRGNLSAGQTEAMEEGFSAVGLDPGVLQPGGGEMLAVLDGGEPVEMETGRDLSYTYTEEGLEAQLQSGGHALLSLNGEEVQLDHEGVLVAVWDRAEGELVQSVAFRPDEGFHTRTD
ncbi:hypothetical protein LJC49_07205 [Ruminococcaceae bacterium OttesenSCG-928-I18]|nr:hypothetical protein [Ruminococcaceae bacterium OttesenSCG-928-I18]